VLIQKRGLSNIVFMVKNSILPDDDISSAAMLRMLAEEAFKESGIIIKGSIELETFSSSDETIVFAHDKSILQLYKFDTAEKMLDAAMQIISEQDNISASILYLDSEYYIAIQNDRSFKALMSEYDGNSVANSSRDNILNNSKVLTDLSSLSSLYYRRKHNG